MSVETELYLVDAVKLEGEVKPAITDFLDHSSPTAAYKLLSETLSGGPFDALRRTDPSSANYFAEGSRDLLDGKLAQEIIDDTTGRITRDTDSIRRRTTAIVLARLLVLYGCARYPNGVPVGITLNRGALSDYIRSRSEWIDDMLSLSNEFLWEAPDLQPSIGGQAKLLTQDQASTLLNALLRIPAPTDSRLRPPYASLKSLIEMAIKDPRYRLLIWTG